MWRYSTFLHQTLQVVGSGWFRILTHGFDEGGGCKCRFVFYAMSTILCYRSIITSTKVGRVPLLLMRTGNYDVCQLRDACQFYDETSHRNIHLLQYGGWGNTSRRAVAIPLSTLESTSAGILFVGNRAIVFIRAFGSGTIVSIGRHGRWRRRTVKILG